VKRSAIIQWLFPELAEQEPAAPTPPKQLPPARPKPGRKPTVRRGTVSSPEGLFQETLGGIGPIVYVRSKKARQLRVTLRPGKPVSVTVPRGESVAHARQFLRSKKAWIGRHLAMFRQFAAQASEHKGPVETLEQSCRRIVGRLGELSTQHGLAYSGVTFRHQKTRWGSCNRNNRLSLNLGLALLPPELLDYVLLHELVHSRIKNHGKAFWAELTGMMPDARARAVELRNHRPS
jgi:predicted metal-dependent hydrolase